MKQKKRDFTLVQTCNTSVESQCIWRNIKRTAAAEERPFTNDDKNIYLAYFFYTVWCVVAKKTVYFIEIVQSDKALETTDSWSEVAI